MNITLLFLLKFTRMPATADTHTYKHTQVQTHTHNTVPENLFKKLSNNA